MKKLIFHTTYAVTPLILRVTLGIVILAHGVQKLFGWFGGYGFQGTMGYFTEHVGLPWIIGLLVIVLETAGAIALILGFATRLIAVSMSILAIGIALSVHVQNGFFMNWGNTQPGEGYEFFLLWLAMSVSLIFSGAGMFSVDRKIAK